MHLQIFVKILMNLVSCLSYLVNMYNDILRRSSENGKKNVLYKSSNIANVNMYTLARNNKLDVITNMLGRLKSSNEMTKTVVTIVKTIANMSKPMF